MLKNLMTTAAVLITLIAPSFAGERTLVAPASADQCDLAQTTRAMAECSGLVAKQTEKIMQSKFEQRLRRTPAYLRDALVKAQKEWQDMRDKECSRDLASRFNRPC